MRAQASFTKAAKRVCQYKQSERAERERELRASASELFPGSSHHAHRLKQQQLKTGKLY